jgi:hypothetical protein
LNVLEVNDVRQTDIHTAEPLVPEPSAFEFELIIEKLKVTNHQVLDQIPEEFIKAGGEQYAVRSINLFYLE